MHHVTHQPDAIEVLGQHPVTVKLHGIDGPGLTRPIGEFRGVGKRVQLEGRGDIQALTTRLAKGIHRGRKGA